jgi:molybdate transport system regulatory protein
MKISARNQFQGKVSAIVPGAVNTEVELTLSGGRQIVSVVTNQSAKALKLKVGNDVVALIKASSVLVMTEAAGLTLSARNCLTGKVKSLHIGPVHAEVAIALDGGAEVHASITHQAATELGLKEGAPATAVFKASSVILGIRS